MLSFNACSHAAYNQPVVFTMQPNGQGAARTEEHSLTVSSSLTLFNPLHIVLLQPRCHKTRGDVHDSPSDLLSPCLS